MKPCWKELGLTKDGAALADGVIDDLVSVLQRIPKELQPRLLIEANFRVFSLPLRTKTYRRNYEKLNYNEVAHGRGRGKRASSGGGRRGRGSKQSRAPGK